MDDSQKEQIICAIYLAVRYKNYRCARTVFDTSIKEIINNTLDKIITLIDEHDQQQLKAQIEQLKHNV